MRRREICNQICPSKWLFFFRTNRSPTQPEDYDSEDADNFSDVSNINENEEPPSFHNELADGKVEDFVDVNEETISDEMSEYTLSTDNTFVSIHVPFAQ